MYENDQCKYWFRRITSFFADEQFPDGLSLLRENASHCIFGFWGKLDFGTMRNAHEWRSFTYTCGQCHVLPVALVRGATTRATLEDSIITPMRVSETSFNPSCTLQFANIWRPLFVNCALWYHEWRPYTRRCGRGRIRATCLFYFYCRVSQGKPSII